MQQISALCTHHGHFVVRERQWKATKFQRCSNKTNPCNFMTNKLTAATYPFPSVMVWVGTCKRREIPYKSPVDHDNPSPTNISPHRVVWCRRRNGCLHQTPSAMRRIATKAAGKFHSMSQKRPLPR